MEDICDQVQYKKTNLKNPTNFNKGIVILDSGWNLYNSDVHNRNEILKTWHFSSKFYLNSILYLIWYTCQWWWTKLWKIKAPPKAILFAWLAIKGAVPTWDKLKRKRQQKPNSCALCEQREESIFHLLVHCHFNGQSPTTWAPGPKNGQVTTLTQQQNPTKPWP